MKNKEIISESAFWNLVNDFENIESFKPKVRKSMKHYILKMQSHIEELETELEFTKSDFQEYKNSVENDYDPEKEVPKIHGKGISY